MSQIQITLRINRETGKKDILIELESDADYTNWEHDQRHREVVEALIEKGIMNETEVGDVTVERIRPVPAQPASDTTKPEQEPPTATP